MGAWHDKIVIEIIARHLELAADKSVLLVMTEAGQRQYGAVINAQFASHPRIVMVEIADYAPALNEEQIGVVTLVAGSMADARNSYNALTEAKRRGFPVVHTLPDLRVSQTPPGWENSGISYPGMFWRAGDYAATIRPSRGAYCEFGVFGGRTFAIAGHALRNVCGRFFAYDSYQGIGGALAQERTHFADGQYSANIQTLRYNLRYAGLEDLDVQVVPGFFKDTLAGRTSRDDEVGPISIVHIDVDVYEPALLALRYVTPDLSDGALLMFDDYDQLAARNDLGERRALREWLAENPGLSVEPYRNYGTFCRSFLFHR